MGDSSMVEFAAVPQPEKGTTEYLKARLTAFAEGIKWGVRNPDDMANFMRREVFDPIFSTKTNEAKNQNRGGWTLGVTIGEGDPLLNSELFRECGAYFVEMSTKSDKVGVDYLISPEDGELESFPQRNADSLVFKVKTEDGALQTNECYLVMIISWKGREGCVGKSKKGSGNDLAEELNNLSHRLKKDIPIEREKNTPIESVVLNFLVLGK